MEFLGMNDHLLTTESSMYTLGNPHFLDADFLGAGLGEKMMYLVIKRIKMFNKENNPIAK